MVDLGLDIAWDMLIGVTMIFSAVALKGRTGFGIWWAAPVMLLGVLMLGLNAATFPYPPGEAGLFDIGPFVGTFMIAVAVRFIVLVRREPGERGLNKHLDRDRCQVNTLTVQTALT